MSFVAAKAVPAAMMEAAQNTEDASSNLENGNNNECLQICANFFLDVNILQVICV